MKLEERLMTNKVVSRVQLQAVSTVLTESCWFIMCKGNGLAAYPTLYTVSS